MSSAIQDVKDLIDHLPEDASIEDIQYHLYMLEKIRRGQTDIREGRHYSGAEARERLIGDLASRRRRVPSPSGRGAG